MSELIKSENQVPSNMISQAIAKGANLAEVRELLSIMKDYEANEARKAYHVAMAEFKKNAPKIDKDKTVRYTVAGKTVEYHHASLANAMDTITKLLGENGLSVSWRNKQNGSVTVVCRITHIKGHFEETELTAGADSTGSKNSIQAIGSTISYLQRYTLLSILGLATYDQDDDGIMSNGVIDDKELSTIRDMLAALNVSEDKLCRAYKIEDLEKLPKKDYQKVINALNAKLKEVKK